MKAFVLSFEGAKHPSEKTPMTILLSESGDRLRSARRLMVQLSHIFYSGSSDIRQIVQAQTT
jgi:hypothetical protein